MSKRSLLLGLVGILCFSNVASAASGVTGIRSINNQQRGIDYKVSSEALQQQADKLITKAEEKEVIQDTPERNTDGITVPLAPKTDDNASSLFTSKGYAPLTTGLTDRELNWLLENNIVSRDGDVKIKADGITVEAPKPLYDRNEPNASMNKSEFLMGAYKALYGVIESRTLVFNLNSWREASEIYYVTDPETGNVVKKYKPKQRQKVSETNKEYVYLPYGKTSEAEREFPEGDYYTYVSPNVFELYLKELVDKHIIELSDIKDMRFQEAYKQLQNNGVSGAKVYPVWYNGLAPYTVTGNISQTNDLIDLLPNSTILGNTLSVTGANQGVSRGSANRSSTITIHKGIPSYFMNESIASMAALKYVEAMLRLTEKDMTDTEARIVTYKYGANYLDGLADSDRKTVMFLTAKGIINFEDPTEYRNLYGNLTKEFAYKLLYRLANKEARTKFSEIQLTDSDNFWLQKGFSQLNIKMNSENSEATNQLKDDSGSYTVSPIPEVETSAVEEVSKAPSTDTTTTSFLGIKIHKRVSQFAAPSDNSSTFLVTKVFDDYRKYRYKGVNLSSPDFNTTKFPEVKVITKYAKSNKWEVKFQVTASNAATAVSTIGSNLQVATDKLFTTKTITAVTKYTEDGQEVVLVPASAFKDVKSDILIMEDKVLKNKKTGAMAVLLQDKNIALVGTHVIHSEDVMVTSLNGDIYYNMAIIKALLSNAYISSLDPTSIYLTKNIYNEHVAPVLGSTGNKMGNSYVASFKGKFAVGGDAGSVEATETSNFLNLSQLTNATNILIREFSKKDETGKGEDMKFTMVLQFMYKLPNKNANFTAPLFDKANPNIADVNKFLYTRPEDKQLADWWDNNLGLSNALANVIYGTSGVDYVKSGYLVPNVTILYDKDNVISSGFLAETLKKVGAEIPGSWVNRFMGSTQTYNTIPTGTGNYVDKNNVRGAYYPIPPQIPKDKLPLWVYAMFNNAGGKVSDNIGVVADKNPPEFKNGTLWRDLMSDRTFDIAKGLSDVADGSTSYNTTDSVFVMTRAGAVYRMIDPTDAKFPVAYDGTVKIRTRTAENLRDYWEKSYVTANGYRFYVSSISGNKITLVDTLRVVGTPMTTLRNGKNTYEINGKTEYKAGSSNTLPNQPNALETRYKELRAMFSPVKLSEQGYDKATPLYKDAKGVTASLPSALMNKGLYFVDDISTGEYGPMDKPFKDYTGSAVKGVSFSEAKKKTVSAHVKITIDANYWAISDSGILFARKSSPYLQIGNVYFSGLNQGLIDSMISKSVGTVDPTTLEDGSTLIIGDMTFVKSGNKFVSQPQTDLTLWGKVLTNAKDSGVVKNAISKMFTGFVVRVSNQDIPLVAFVKNPALGVPVNGMKLDKTLIGSLTNSSSPEVATTSNDNKYTTVSYSGKKLPTVKSVIFSIELYDKSLLARPLDEETKTYQLMLSTNSLSEGFISNIPFFDESLDLGEKDDMFLMMQRSNFKPLVKAGDIRDNFVNMYQDAFRGDIISWLRLAGISILSLMIIVSWICYAVLRNGLAAYWIDLLRNPGRGSTRNGFDIIKVVSFGLFNSDTQPQLSRVIISNIIMFGIIYILLEVIQKGGS